MDDGVGPDREEAWEEALGDKVLGVLDELLVGGGVLCRVVVVVVAFFFRFFEGRKRSGREKRETRWGCFERADGNGTVEWKKKTKKKTPHLLRQEVDGRRPEHRGELQAGDHVDEVDVVARPGKGRGREERGMEAEVEKKKGMSERKRLSFFFRSLLSFVARASLSLSLDPGHSRRERAAEREKSAKNALVKVLQRPDERLFRLDRVIDGDEDCPRHGCGEEL